MTWLKVKEVADILKITVRAVQKDIKMNKYEYRHVNGKGRGGVQYEILLESLPQEAQDRYYNKSKEYKPIFHYTSKQRNEADRRAYVVLEYQQSLLSPDEFLEKYNADNPHFQVSKSQLFRWQKKLKTTTDVADLVDKRGGHNRGQCSIDDEIWEYFYSLYMKPQKLKIQRCYDLTKKQYPNLPSVKTFERKVKTIPEYAIIAYRNGPKALNDSLPYMERDYTTINSNDVWYSDHHKADVFVRDNKGNIGRPWITMWTDARSRKVMSCKVRMESPNTDIVKDSLRVGIQENGCPNELYVDNGKDYKAKDGLNKDYPLSLVNRLGINTIYATKYHGQAKNIERFFGTLEERFGKLFDTYAGRDAKERPESLKLVPVDQYPTLEEYTNHLMEYLIEYHDTPHSGNGMDNKTPNQVYSENLKVKKQIQDHDALRLLCGRVVERTVLRNGINMFDTSYWHDDLVYHYKEKVVVIYDTENIEEINIFDQDGRAICKAESKLKTPFRNTTSQDYKEAKKKQKAVKKLVKELEPTRDLQAWQLIAQDQALEKQYAEKSNPTIVDVATSQMKENIDILKQSKKSSNLKETDEIDIASGVLKSYANKKAQGE